MVGHGLHFPEQLVVVILVDKRAIARVGTLAWTQRVPRRKDTRIATECWDAQPTVLADGPEPLRDGLGDPLELGVLQKCRAGFLDIDEAGHVGQRQKIKPARLKVRAEFDELLAIRCA